MFVPASLRFRKVETYLQLREWPERTRGLLLGRSFGKEWPRYLVAQRIHQRIGTVSGWLYRNTREPKTWKPPIDSSNAEPAARYDWPARFLQNECRRHRRYSIALRFLRSRALG